LVNQLGAAYDASGGHFLDNVDVGGVTLKEKFQDYGLLFILGLVNSGLLRWYFPFVSAPFRGGWRSANKQFLSLLPIPLVDFSNNSDVKKHDRMVALVTKMLKLNEELPKARTAHSKELIQRQLDATDKAIDRLVYELYELTADEIAIVEAATS